MNLKKSLDTYRKDTTTLLTGYSIVMLDKNSTGNVRLIENIMSGIKMLMNTYNACT